MIMNVLASVKAHEKILGVQVQVVFILVVHLLMVIMQVASGLILFNNGTHYQPLNNWAHHQALNNWAHYQPLNNRTHHQVLNDGEHHQALNNGGT